MLVEEKERGAQVKDSLFGVLRSAGRILACVCVALVCVLALPGSAYAGSAVNVTLTEQEELLGSARLGVYEGGLTSIYAEEDFPHATLLEYENVFGIASALGAGKVDYGLVPLESARLFMQSNPDFSYLSPGVCDFGIRIGVAKGNDDLLQRVNAAIATLSADGTLDAVQKKWFEDADYSLDDIPVREDGELLRVAVCGSDEPVSFVYDGQLVGCDVEIAMRIAYELGMRVEFQDMAFPSELTAVTSGTADLAMHYAYSKERAERIDFSDPLYTERWVAMFKVESDAVLSPLEALTSNFTKAFVAESRWQMVLEGLGVTLAIALASFALGTLGGAFLCWLGRRGGTCAAFAHGYVRIVTGIPTLVWLLLLYYVVFKNSSIPGGLVAIICLGLESSAPLSGVFQMGLSSVGAGQVEACAALGLSRRQTMRHVVMPQALVSVWKLYSGQLTGLIKATSIVGYVAVTDLTKASDIIRSRTFEALFPLVSTALVYLAVILAFSWLLGLVARRFNPRHRDAARILKGIEVRS